MQLQDYFELLKNQLIQAGDELLGLAVRHQSLGDGVIAKVEKRTNQKSLLDIQFSSGKKAAFNDLSEPLFQILPQADPVTDAITNHLLTHCKEILDEQQAQKELLGKRQEVLKKTAAKYELIFEKLQHYNIANFYAALMEDAQVPTSLMDLDGKNPSGVSSPGQQNEGSLDMANGAYQELGAIEQIIQKIDLGLDLADDEVQGLERKKLFNLLATASYRSYRKTNDLWTLVQACKYLRRAKMPQRVIELTQELAAGSTAHPRTKIFSAIYTTRGAAFKDISDFDNAKEMANLALACEESKYSHTLMGAICYWGLDFSKGDAHFHRASALGSTMGDRIMEIRIASQRLDAAGKAKLQAHLNSINLKI